jgi:hypothetical protein
MVVDDLVLSVSTANHFHSSRNRLWIPSTIKIIPSKCDFQKTRIQSIALEIGSKLRKIITERLSVTNLEFFTFAGSVEV